VIAALAGLTTLLALSEEGQASLGRIFDAIRPAISGVADIFASIWELIQPLVEVLGEVLPPLISALVPAFEAVAAVIRTIVDWVKKIVGAIIKLLEIVGIISTETANAARATLAGDSRREQQAQRSSRTREAVTAQGRGPADVRSFFSAFQNAALRQDAARIPERQLAVQERIEQNTRPPGAAPAPSVPPSVA
jgi:hypothetical protein